mmetsp:Transcript_9384/g.14794  ORF Transcript_9384/g.14794 Transcript_9384/m.14794 type:complete len:165 (+) Transcript_9384:26-520(+)|eukprot:CAMPEP_0179455978 /NCGR_PEP_ID=MMETSP0799-20121207/39815_1 /TAXON_ID=46947 /ORGANISM="Geminigera cryophila, Strain CCMP2564" /LENGTH=164 /DNA_ID=CAMNT_0021255343 /DNA_START=3 /DNA_END=497 /DNA_ORIENTATION=-
MAEMSSSPMPPPLPQRRPLEHMTSAAMPPPPAPNRQAVASLAADNSKMDGKSDGGVAGGGSAHCLSDGLPKGWKAVPSLSRPGEYTYVHTPSGLKQSRRPLEGEVPSEEAVEAFQDAVARAKRKKLERTKPLLANEATANWQAYVKGGAKKKEREQRKRERSDS